MLEDSEIPDGHPESSQPTEGQQSCEAHLRDIVLYTEKLYVN